MSDSSGPQTIHLVRHGEKLGDASSDKDGGPDLSVRGSARGTRPPVALHLDAGAPRRGERHGAELRLDRAGRWIQCLIPRGIRALLPRSAPICASRLYLRYQS